MKINTAKTTRHIIRNITPAGSKLRRVLLQLKTGESITMPIKNWPFKSEPAEYLYTMRRVKRTYSYQRLGNSEILIWRTS